MSKIVTRLEDLAFEEILRSAYETLKVECGGILFGEIKETKTKSAFNVEYAHPIQLALRYPNGVTPLNDSSRSYWSVMEESIGGYHSHTYGRGTKK